MAIDYGNYAAQYGAASGHAAGFDQLNQGIANAMDNNKERRQLQATQMDDRIWNDIIMKPFTTAAYGGVDTWGSSVFSMDAGKALRTYKTEALKNPRLYNILSQQGLLNPMAFKQKYDQMTSQYTPLINRKLEFFADEKGWTDRELQKYITDTGNSGLQNFLMDHSEAGTLAYEAGKQYKNIGLFGGAVESATGPASMALYGPGGGAVVGAGRELWKSGWAKRDLSKMVSAAGKGANPFRFGLKETMKRKGLYTGVEKDLTSSMKKGTTPIGKETSARLRKRYEKIKAKKRGATNTYNKAKAKWKGPSFDTSKLGKPLKAKQVKFARVATKAQNQIAKGPMFAMKKYIKKNGTGSLIKLIAKKVGYGKAALLAGKLAVGTATSWAGIGVAINIWTLIDIGRVVTNAMKETGGIQRPDKMLFGE